MKSATASPFAKASADTSLHERGMSAACVLITRPERDAASLAHTLSARGYATFTEPMLSLMPVAEGEQALRRSNARDFHGVIITSRHATAALSAHAALRGLPLYAVGEATANAARAVGFNIITTAPTAAELARIINSAAPAPLLYPRGEHVTQDMQTLLPHHSITECVVYRMEARGEFSAELIEKLANHALHIAIFFSARTAEVFVRLAAPHAALCKPVHAVAFSENVATALQTLPWKSVHIAANPTLAALLEAVDNAAASR